MLDGSLESGKNGAKLLPADLNRPKGDSTFSAVDVLQAMAQDETACGITGIDDTAIVGSCMERQEPPAEEQAGGHLGDGIRVALLLLVAAEFAVQGSLLWSPLAAVVATASSRVSPSLSLLCLRVPLPLLTTFSSWFLLPPSSFRCVPQKPHDSSPHPSLPPCLLDLPVRPCVRRLPLQSPEGRPLLASTRLSQLPPFPTSSVP